MIKFSIFNNQIKIHEIYQWSVSIRMVSPGCLKLFNTQNAMNIPMNNNMIQQTANYLYSVERIGS